MKDIARLTGLGLATISSYFNGGNVREKNRVKIEEAIEELHYEVNEVARGLKTNATKTIGVVIPEPQVFLLNAQRQQPVTAEAAPVAGRGGIFKPETSGRDHQHAGGRRGQSSEKIPENREAHRTY